jgi:hypothetical protein
MGDSEAGASKLWGKLGNLSLDLDPSGDLCQSQPTAGGSANESTRPCGYLRCPVLPAGPNPGVMLAVSAVNPVTCDWH